MRGGGLGAAPPVWPKTLIIPIFFQFEGSAIGTYFFWKLQIFNYKVEIFLLVHEKLKFAPL